MRPSSRDFEVHLALAVIFDSRFREYVCDQIKPEIFTEFDCQYIYETALRLRSRKKPITFFSVYEAIRRDTNLSDPKATSICEILAPYITPGADLSPVASMLDGVLSAVEDMVKSRVIEMALVKSVDLWESGGVDEIMPLWDQAGQQATYGVPSRISLWEELEKDITVKEMLNYQIGIPTGIHGINSTHEVEHLDRRLFFKGCGRGHLGIVLADSNMGKTTFMQNLGLAQSLRSHNVEYYSLEMDKEYLQARSISILTGIPTDDIIQDFNGKKIRKKLDEVYEKYPKRGTFHISHYTKNNLSMSTIARDLTMNQKEGKPTDSIIVDYLDLMQPDRRFKELRHEIGHNAITLRALGGDFNCAVFTPSQMNRATFKDRKKAKDRAGIAEDYSKVFTCDYLWVLSEYLQEVTPIGKQVATVKEMVKLFVDKNRFGRRGMTYVLSPNKDIGMFYDIFPKIA